MYEGNDLDHTAGLTDEEMDRRFKEAVRIENEIKRIKGNSIAGYDTKKKAPYVEYPDGRKVYIY